MKMLNSFGKNKKAQTGETITWIVATFIIIGILAIGIYTASILGKTKSIKEKGESIEEKDLIKAETEMAFQINSANKNEINSWIEKEEDEDELFDFS